MLTAITRVCDQALPLIALSLIHLLWQGAVLGGILALVLFLHRQANPDTRYALAVSTLALIALCPVITFFVLTLSRQSPEQIAVQSRMISFVPLAHGAANLKTAPVGLAPSVSMLGGGRQFLNSHPRQIVLAWLGGVLLLALRGIGGWFSLRSLTQGSNESQEVNARIASIAARMSVSRVPQLRVIGKVASPLVYGAFRAVIVIPTSAIVGLTPEMLDTILAHELAHVRRHDYLVNVAQCVVETVLFYHPAVWWVSRRIRDEREVCCDEMVIATLDNRITYARALEGLEHLRARSLAVSAEGGMLLKRIKRIVGAGRSDMIDEVHGRCSGQLAAGIGAVVIGIGLLAAVNAPGNGGIGDSALGQEAPQAAAPVIPRAEGRGAVHESRPIEGPGITITLTDSTLTPGPGHQPAEALIRDSDLQQLVIELQTAGATKIAISEQQVSADTRIRAAGNNITVNNFALGRPFVIRALGNPETLRKAVEPENGVLGRLRQFDPAMVAIEMSDHVSLPAHQADQPKAAYRIDVRLIRCDVSGDGSAVETVVGKPSAITFAETAATFSVTNSSGEGYSLTLEPRPGPGRKINLKAGLTITDNDRVSMSFSNEGFVMGRDKFVRILGVVKSTDIKLRKLVESGKEVRNLGAYHAYYLEAKVE